MEQLVMASCSSRPLLLFTCIALPAILFWPCARSQKTVSTIEEIKTGLRLGRFTGDPCLPVGYGYSWLKCTEDSGITALLLSNYSTGGKIPVAINSLTALTEVHLDGNALEGEIPDLSALANLETLDLSNNKLNGSIPSFLTSLNNLKVLYLQNNSLTGEIPDDLLQRKKASQLNFEISGNPLCENSNEECSSPPSDQSKKKSSTGLIIAVEMRGYGSSSPFPTPISEDSLCENSNVECSSPPPPSESRKNSSTGLIIGVVVAGTFVIIAMCIVFKKKERIDTQQELPLKFETPSPVINNKVIPKLSVKAFSWQKIRDVTNNFSTKLGEGGFGPVYKGCLQDGLLVAIKVSSKQSHEGSKEFINEVDLLSRVHHKNLVRLLGYCNREKLVLVYEFMSNGSLFDCLHGPYSRASPLSWATRLHILVDSAQGLDYLHNGCSPRIIHRDVKSGNILLSDRMEAKISDFGISRDNIETGAPLTALMGSMGYMDPEYLSLMQVTDKVDVYSFGVLLFEVVCGKKPIFRDSSQQPVNLVEWARASIDRGVIDDIVDATLDGQFDVHSVWKVVEVALACVEIPSTKRPKMSDVYLELKEAERMELESEERSAIDKPSVEFTGVNSLYTHVSAR